MNKSKEILIIMATLLVVIILFKTCSTQKTTKAGEEIKTDTIYIIKDKIITIKDTIVKLKYKNKYLTNTKVKEELESKIDSGQITIDYWDYFYTLDTIYIKDNSETNLKINGWGYVNDIELNTIIKDTTIIINKEITKIKPSKGLYLSPEYIRPFNIDDLNKPTYRVNLDYINGNLLLGTGIGVQNEQPNWSIRIGYKLK